MVYIKNFDQINVAGVMIKRFKKKYLSYQFIYINCLLFCNWTTELKLYYWRVINFLLCVSLVMGHKKILLIN